MPWWATSLSLSSSSSSGCSSLDLSSSSSRAITSGRLVLLLPRTLFPLCRPPLCCFARLGPTPGSASAEHQTTLACHKLTYHTGHLPTDHGGNLGVCLRLLELTHKASNKTTSTTHAGQAVDLQHRQMCLRLSNQTFHAQKDSLMTRSIDTMAHSIYFPGTAQLGHPALSVSCSPMQHY